MTIETEVDNGSDRDQVGEEVKDGETKSFQDPLDEAKQSWWWGNRTDFWALRCRACQQAMIELIDRATFGMAYLFLQICKFDVIRPRPACEVSTAHAAGDANQGSSE